MIVQAGRVVEEGYGPIFLEAEFVDCIVVHPGTEQVSAAYRGAVGLVCCDLNIKKNIAVLSSR